MQTEQVQRGMPQQPVAITIVLVTLLASAGFVLTTGALRGWLVLVACGVIGAVMLLSHATRHRVVTAHIAVYVLLTGVSVGLPKVWVSAPAWVHVIAEVSFWISLGVVLRAAWFARTRRTTAA